MTHELKNKSQGKYFLKKIAFNKKKQILIELSSEDGRVFHSICNVLYDERDEENPIPYVQFKNSNFNKLIMWGGLDIRSLCKIIVDFSQSYYDIDVSCLDLGAPFKRPCAVRSENDLD